MKPDTAERRFPRPENGPETGEHPQENDMHRGSETRRRARRSPFVSVALGACLLAVPGLLFAQAEEEEAEAAPQPAELVVTPAEVELEVGETLTLEAEVLDENGEAMDRSVVFFSRRRRSVGVNPAGIVEAYRPGEHTLIAMVPKDPEDLDRRAEPAVRVEIPVTIPNPPAAAVSVTNLPAHLYAGTEIALRTEVEDTSGAIRNDVEVRFATADDSVAAVDALGVLRLAGEGSTTLTVSAEEVSSDTEIVVTANPVRTITLTGGESDDPVRTGDVVFFSAEAKDAGGEPVPDYPIQFATLGTPADGIVAPGAIGQITADGAFVAERSGTHTVIADGFTRSATATLKVVPRMVRKGVEVLGQAPVRDRHTSDLWVWEGTDGRDYAVTGTWGADGHAYFWDVTDPSAMSLIDTVRVDARTVNDVKVSEDGKFCVISREGASNRKNGLVILDVSDPQNGVQVIARYDDQLSGGVHNVFIAENHIYALSAGRRYDIINAEDPTNPYRVGRFELDTPGHSIHDVWVEDGIAYSSNWNDGVVAVDVGGGGMGGAPNNPVLLGSTPYPNGWNHAAYPYRSQSTGKFLMIGGDEAFPYQTIEHENAPSRAAGWIHIFEWDDWDEPKEVARYQVPEAGTHNLWVEDDLLYIAYYNGGLRVVDLSGELRGDLYRQGREVAMFLPQDPESFIPNAPMVWGPQPYKGNIFIADHNSGLWAVKLVDAEPVYLGEPQD